MNGKFFEFKATRYEGENKPYNRTAKNQEKKATANK